MTVRSLRQSRTGTCLFAAVGMLSLFLCPAAVGAEQSSNYILRTSTISSGGHDIEASTMAVRPSVISEAIGGATQSAQYAINIGLPIGSSLLTNTPPTGTVLIDDDADYTTTREVTLILEATDEESDVVAMRFSNDGLTYDTPRPYAPTALWILDDGDGVASVFAQFQDEAEQWSDPASDTIILDTTAPIISDVAATDIATTSASITWITNEPATTQIEYGETLDYGAFTARNPTLRTTHDMRLSDLAPETLYHYRVHSDDVVDHAAVSADATFTTIALPDTTPPTGTVRINADGDEDVTGTTAVILTLEATDTEGDVVAMRFSNDGIAYDTPRPYATTADWLLDDREGTATVYAQFQDEADNWSEPTTDDIVLDALPPVITITSPPDGYRTNMSSVLVSGTVDDTLTAVDVDGVVADRDGLHFTVAVLLDSIDTHLLTITAISPRGLESTRELTVMRGAIPTIVAAMPTEGAKLYWDAPATLSIEATDAEDDPLTYQWLLDEASLTDWTSDDALVWTPSQLQAGPHVLEFRVRDAYGGYGTVAHDIFILREPVTP
jgi:hypothetical protein